MPQQARDRPLEPVGAFHYLPVTDRLLHCELYLTALGSRHYPPGSSYPDKCHPQGYDFNWQSGRRLSDFALVWLSAGRGTREFQDREPTLFQTDEVIFLTPGAWHRYRPNPETGWCEHWLCLNGEHLHRLRLRGFLPADNRSLGVITHRQWESTFQDLHQAVAEEPGQTRPEWGAMGLQILLTAAGAAKPPSTSPDRDPLLLRALKRIREHAHRQIMIEVLAAELKVSPRTLERHFAARHIRGVREEIIHVRLERACRLLGQPEIPIKEIAYTCGFQSPKAMNYNFRRFRQTTPSEIRKALLCRQG